MDKRCSPIVYINNANNGVVLEYPYNSNMNYNRWLNCINLDLNNINQTVLQLEQHFYIKEDKEEKVTQEEIKSFIEKSPSLKMLLKEIQKVIKSDLNDYKFILDIIISIKEHPQPNKSSFMKLFRKIYYIFTSSKDLTQEDEILTKIRFIKLNLETLLEDTNNASIIFQSLTTMGGRRKKVQKVVKHKKSHDNKVNKR